MKPISYSVPDEFKKLRDRAGLSMDELARSIGYRRASSIQRYESQDYKKDTLAFDLVQKLADAIVGMGSPPIEINEVLALARPDLRSGAKRTLTTFDPDALEDAGIEIPHIDQTGEIPEIDLVAGLGGGGLSIVENTSKNGITFHKEAVRDHWRLPDWMLSRMNVRANHVAAFPSQGDSMTPTIDDGDVVFIDTRHRVPSPPGIYALADEFGGVIVKRLEVTSRPGDEIITVQISSDNPRHTTRELTLDEIQIIGRYIGRFTI
jgi:transcriptional regulator with XRE-family HTH domain